MILLPVRSCDVSSLAPLALPLIALGDLDLDFGDSGFFTAEGLLDLADFFSLAGLMAGTALPTNES